jgi:hypothetical protein
MKTIKSLVGTFAAITALAFFTTSAQATIAPGIGITTNFSPLTVAITVITNGPEVTSGHTLTDIVGKSAINNTFLLSLFGHWANTNWPTGSKLEVSWDFNGGTNSGDVVVTDKTGTNVLYDASAGTNNYFRVYYFLDPGASYIKGTATGTNSLSMFTYTDYDDGYCELYDNNVYLLYTDVYLYGGSTVTFTQNWNTQNVPTTWSVKADLTAADNAADWFLDIQYTTASGTVNVSGNGKGLNSYFYSP